MRWPAAALLLLAAAQLCQIAPVSCSRRSGKSAQIQPQAHIITTVFNGYSEEREQEVYTAIWNNMKLSYVSKIHLFAEGIDVLDIVAKLLAVSTVLDQNEIIMWKDTIRQKLVVIRINQQPTYADFVNYAEENLSGSLVGITNADMYFDETIGCATSQIKQMRDGKYIYAITKAAAKECPYGVFSSKFWSRRFERVKEYIPGLQNSVPFVCGLNNFTADSFLYVPPLGLTDQTLKYFDFPQNRIFAENRFAYLMQEYGGLKVINACRKIFVHHLHCSFERKTETKVRIDGDGLELNQFDYPDFLEQCPIGSDYWHLWKGESDVWNTVEWKMFFKGTWIKNEGI